MTSKTLILPRIPDMVTFYRDYWGKKPFIVKKAIPDMAFGDHMITTDELAGLSMEEDVKSRLVKTPENKDDWQCAFGPFEEEDLTSLPDENWALLVQNTERHFPPTANLIRFFPFAPQWFMDDIMISLSAKGGTVGPHLDSYHVFLIQGIGQRQWKIGYTAMTDEDCIQGIDLKILKEDFDGETVTVTQGDVIYIPPQFPHAGITDELAMTFSLGFLGPQISDLMAEYGYYLGQFDAGQRRYLGTDLTQKSRSGHIAPDTATHLRAQMTDYLNDDFFEHWLAHYFSAPSTASAEDNTSEPISDETWEQALENKQALHKPFHLKSCMTVGSEGQIFLGIDGDVITCDAADRKLCIRISRNQEITPEMIAEHPLICKTLYQKQYLVFDEQAMEGYYQGLKDREPRRLLQQALAYCTSDHKDSLAYDLGCGLGQDSTGLLKAGFDVVSLDISSRAFDHMAENFPETAAKVTKIISPIEEAKIKNCQFINAQYSLHFMTSEVFDETVPNLLNKIDQGGIFCGNFLGKNDDWLSRYTTNTEDELRSLFQDFDILHYEDYEEDKDPVIGGSKHWHLIDIIARKK